MREITRSFGIVTDFPILVEQDRQILAAKLRQGADLNRTVMIIPLLATEFTEPQNQPIFENILNHLARVTYLHTIIFGLDQADKAEADFLQDLLSKHRISNAIIQWNDGPIFSHIYDMLHESGLISLSSGKGKNIFLGFGLALALKAKAIGLIDADIRSFDCIQVDRLLYPVVVHNYDFSKAYYTRISEGRMFGRVKRLLVDPILLALKTKFMESKDQKMLGLIDFLLQFQYQLSGEMVFRADILKKMRFATNWGAEIFTLIEIYRKAATAAQVEFAKEPFDHKHQPVCEDDPTKGLNRMAVDIVTTLINALVQGEGLEVTENFFRDLYTIYSGVTDKLTKMYSDEAAFNDLSYDWDEEEYLAKQVFGKSILRAGDILSELPVTIERILHTVYRCPQFKPFIRNGLVEAVLSIGTSEPSPVFETPVTVSWDRVSHKIPEIYDVLLEAIRQEKPHTL